MIVVLYQSVLTKAVFCESCRNFSINDSFYTDDLCMDGVEVAEGFFVTEDTEIVQEVCQACRRGVCVHKYSGRYSNLIADTFAYVCSYLGVTTPELIVANGEKNIFSGDDGHYDPERMRITVNVRDIGCEEDAVSIVAHELTHHYQTVVQGIDIAKDYVSIGSDFGAYKYQQVEVEAYQIGDYFKWLYRRASY